MAEITDVIIDLMNHQQEMGDGWMRSADIQAALGLSHKTVMRYLQILNEQNRLEVKRIPMQSVAGYTTPVPAYRLRPIENDFQ